MPDHTDLVRVVGIEASDGVGRGLADRDDLRSAADRVPIVCAIPEVHAQAGRKKAGREARSLEPHHVVHGSHERTGQAWRNHIGGGVVQVMTAQGAHRARPQ